MKIFMQYACMWLYTQSHSLFVFFIFSKSASCTHVSALLLALLIMSESELPLFNNPTAATESEEEVIPITWYACEWKLSKTQTW